MQNMIPLFLNGGDKEFSIIEGSSNSKLLISAMDIVCKHSTCKKFNNMVNTEYK